VNCHSERSEEPTSSSNSSLATHHSSLPQTRPPHSPLPTTRAEFAQQVLAGLNSSRSETPARDPLGKSGHSASPSSSAPASTSTSSSSSSAPPQSPANCHSKPSARREESASSSNSSLATHHSPLATSSTRSPARATRLWHPRQLGRLDSP
jgi:hypothetical protein